MPDLRIPPAITFKFERLVAEVCNQAKLDTDQWPLRARELLSHLQERWREGVEAGLNDTDAQARALELFGSPKSVARGLRQPWLKRLLYHQNCRLHRQFIFLTATLCGNLLLVLVQLILYRGENLEAARYAGSFSNAFIALGSLLVIQWRPEWPRWIRTILLVRHLLWVFVGLGLINVALNAPMAFVLSWQISWWILAAPFMAGAIPLGFLGAACFWSEIFDLAGRRRAKTQELIAFRIIK